MSVMAPEAPLEDGPITEFSDMPARLPFPPITYSHILHCSYHNWHPRYRALTPKSRLIPLSPQFVSYLRADGIVLPSEPTLTNDNDELDTYSDSGEEEADPSSEWQEVHTQIKNIIAELGTVAPKLNWSAPKDATFMSATNDLKCHTANDIYLLLKSSDFITHDLEHPFDDCVSDFTANANNDVNCDDHKVLPEVPYHLVLRKYVNFNPSLEFRCFVRNRKLLCMCQRDQNHFDFLFGMRDLFRSRIQSFFDDKLRDTFPDPNFVFDVYVPAPHQRVWLIDINPWAQRTDPLLFSWLEILRMKDPIGFEEDSADDISGTEGFVRISLRDGTVMSSSDLDESGEESESSEEEVEAEDADNAAACDDFALFLPEVRLIKKNDPEAYQFSTPQYSAHKVPKDLVDASLAGPGGMSEFMGKWQDILQNQMREEQQASDSD
ncbi:Cell division cycle protein [Penicillium taxi]|uniref:Cell division cycle protein n=1 Tax=Penicillium taxi TaxID=168475 RepID=UPI0025456F17|nr:Cell division cycle protein [Penicillium taxi]KAJ5887673.1 Cell division cycle protein [Penicillium taxi]